MVSLKVAALKAGFLPGHTNYTRFIILGRSRSGSNLLRGLLNSHSQVTVFGEIFQNDRSIGWALPGYRQTTKLLDLFRRAPVHFVMDHVFHRFPLQTKAVGFKIFYYHAQSENWKSIWDYLQSEKDLKVIHIRRHNILKTHLSRKLAMLTDQWVDTSGSRPITERIELDYDELIKDFIQTRQWETQAVEAFHDHSMIEVIYEELARDYVGIMRSVQSFLGVDEEIVQPETHKQSSRPLAYSIINFNELRKKFLGTPWETFFEEG